MKTVHKYLLSEICRPFLIGLFTFSLVVLLHRFAKIADLVIAKGVPAALVGRLFLSLFPTFFEITLPAALLLSVLLALGRLSADSETIALGSAGFGMRGMALPVLLLSGGTFFASLFIAWDGIAWGNKELRETLSRIVSVRAGAGASEHVFQEITPDVLLYPDRVSADGTRMTGVLVSQRVTGQDPLLVFAKEGEFAPGKGGGAVRLLLSDGTIHHEEAAAGVYRAASFRRMEFLMPAGFAGAPGGDDPKAFTLPELYRKVSADGSAARSASFRYHFHRRLSLAFSCLAFGLLAIPLGLSQRARGRSPAFALTVAVILFYYLFLAAARALESSAPRAMILVLWLPNALGLLLACFILWRSESRALPLSGLFRRRPGRGGRK